MCGGGGGGGSSESTTTMRAVPEWAEPQVILYAQTAYDAWKAGTLSAYGGTIVAAQNQDELDGIDGLANRGRYGDQVISKGIAYLDDVINDGYLDGTKSGFLAALAKVTGKSTASFADVSSRIGRKLYFVTDPDATLLAQSLSAGYPATYNARITAAIYAENYAKERAIQDHALGFGVEMGKHAAIDGEALRRAGLYMREYLQGTYELDHKRFIEQQEMAVANLEIFGNCLRALTGSSSKSTETMEGAGGNKVMGAVGGVVAGAMIGSMFGGIPGAIIGGAIGGIVGWFS